MDLNYWSQADMAHAILGAWLTPDSIASATAQGAQRHLIFTSTSLAFYSIAGYGPYSPPKTALRALSDTLTQEVLLYTPSTVKIHTVFPGGIQTPGFEAESLTKPAITAILEADDPIQSPEVVAQKSVQGPAAWICIAPPTRFASIRSSVTSLTTPWPLARRPSRSRSARAQAELDGQPAPHRRARQPAARESNWSSGR